MLNRLLDSVILIDHLNGVPAATALVQSLDPAATAISVVTRAEILAGVEKTDAALVKAFLDQFHLLFIDKDVADLAASLRKSRGWKLPDAFQTALSLHHKIKLTTRNTKDFNPQECDFVEVPYNINERPMGTTRERK
jgi:predicted nucleic acid-binding protein